MKKWLWICIVLSVAALGAMTGQAAVATGDEAPEFTLTDTSGQEHSLSDFAGKIVVLEWINHGCPFVRKHYDGGNMQSLQEEYTEKGVVWLSICSSAPGKQGHYSAEAAAEVTSENEAAPTAYLLDEDGTVGKAYAAKTTPHMYVVDAEGTLVYQGAIDSIRSTDKDDCDEADNYVAQAVDALLAGEEVETGTTTPYGCSVKYAD